MRDHRSLEAWKEARELTRLAIRAQKTHWKPAARVLLDQLQRATLSTQLNIAEGYAVGGKPRFVNHLSMAYGSAVESAEILELCLEEGFLPRELGTEALRRNSRCQALLMGLIKRYRKE